jgi:FtsZ-interacting cell division protein ZipA
MPAWIWVIIAIAVIAIVVATILSASRRRRVQSRFGPEYDRAVTETGSRRRAASELTGREKRRRQLNIVPLETAARERYAEQWQVIQARFVDHPTDAVREADALVMTVMQERGYPVENFEQRSADISVDHPHVVDNYRAAHGISLADQQGKASTEDLRQAMVHYRSLFDELLGKEQEVPDSTRHRRVS